jgi:hypothetical protein
LSDTAIFEPPLVDLFLVQTKGSAVSLYAAMKASMCSCNNAAIFQLNRSPQPALDIEQNPLTARMMTNCPEHQLPINAVECSTAVKEALLSDWPCRIGNHVST